MWSFCLWLQPSHRGSVGGPASRRWLTLSWKESWAFCSLLFYRRFLPCFPSSHCPSLLFQNVSSVSQRSCNVPRPRARSHLTPQTGTLTSQCLSWGFPPLFPIASVLPIPSTILPNYSIFFFPSPLSWAVPLIETIVSCFLCLSLSSAVILNFLMSWNHWTHETVNN